MSQRDEEMLISSIYNDFTSSVLGKVVAEVKNKTSLSVKAAVGGERYPDIHFIRVTRFADEDSEGNLLSNILIQQTSETKGRGF